MSAGMVLVAAAWRYWPTFDKVLVVVLGMALILLVFILIVGYFSSRDDR